MEFSGFVNQNIGQVEKEMELILSAGPRSVYGMLGEYIFRGGKRLRPALFMLSFGALGGKGRKNALKAAALIELFHNFTLIHDDIEDDSHFRRGKPTLHISHGIPMAINSGDALYTLVWNRFLALDLAEERKVKLASICGCSFQRVVEGQGVELDWYKTAKTGVSEEDYFEMVLGKTGALMGASCEAGAFLAGADSRTMEKFRLFGESLGMAFQIWDDILNITGDFKKYRKEIGGDITEGKRSLMFIHAMAHATEAEKRKLSSILLSGTRDEKKIGYVVSIFRKYDSINYAGLRALSFVEEAGAFLRALPPSRERDELLGLSRHVIKREF
ncbi:MAG: polyprenyl synthetase family protein [Candidatus ainarchaeum sp.]|nr:polyprenyl synthetase family protein [Candidatus ainarchaeum sp.]